MQHLDEGTIHSWLDGALTPEEAARVEAHAAGCPECAAAVAEARGFIAASSRILTSLDHAPRGVIPAAAPKKRFDPFAWRIAATLLVVAAGTLVVVRNRGTDQHSTAPDTTASSLNSAMPAMSPAPAQVGGSAQAMAPQTAIVKPQASRVDAARKTVPRAPAPVPAGGPVAGVAGDRAEAASGVVSGNQGLGAGGNPAAVGARSAPSAAAFRAADVTTGRPATSTSLKVIAQPRRIGASVTVYEIEGDTVTLAESRPLELQGVVATGADAATIRQAEKAEPRRAATLSAPVAPAAPVAATAAKAADSTNVVTWHDPATNSTLTLTGRVSPARLGQLKAMIERERAAAAATRKNP